MCKAITHLNCTETDVIRSFGFPKFHLNNLYDCLSLFWFIFNFMVIIYALKLTLWVDISKFYKNNLFRKASEKSDFFCWLDFKEKFNVVIFYGVSGFQRKMNMSTNINKYLQLFIFSFHFKFAVIAQWLWYSQLLRDCEWIHIFFFFFSFVDLSWFGLTFVQKYKKKNTDIIGSVYAIEKKT